MSLDLRHPTLTCTPGAHDWVRHFDAAGMEFETCTRCGKRARWIPIWTAG